MPEKNLWTLLLLIFTWGLALLAGVAFLRGAHRVSRQPAAKGWRGALKEIKFRLQLALGVALVLWVAGSLAWGWFYWR